MDDKSFARKKILQQQLQQVQSIFDLAALFWGERPLLHDNKEQGCIF